MSRRRDAQIGSALGPDMGQIGMGERFGLIPEQEHDIARLGLRFQELAAQAGAIHGIGVLAGFQSVARPAPAEIPLWRSTTDRREREIRTPERFSISSAKRGSVQLGRSATGPNSTASATVKAHAALTGAGPGATDFRSAGDSTLHESAAPEAHRILAHSEGLGDPHAGPARQGQKDRPGPISLAALPRPAEPPPARIVARYSPQQGTCLP